MPKGTAMFDVKIKEFPEAKNPHMRVQVSFTDSENRPFVGFEKDFDSAKADAIHKREKLLRIK